MRKLYVITRGEYSDYSIVAAFTEKDKALEWASHLDAMILENHKRRGERWYPHCDRVSVEEVPADLGLNIELDAYSYLPDELEPKTILECD